MNNVTQVIESAHALVAKCEYATAQDLLVGALSQFPEDKDLQAEVGIIYCFGQKEFEAADCLVPSVGADRHPILSNLLRDYFYCRKKLAQKLGVLDDKGDAVLKRIGRLFEGKPQGVGVKLSACLIVKNEEKHLERCLKSIKPIVDEIVVVDTGSTDRTVEIAENFKAKIGHFDWCDDFSAARNASLDLATGNWVLWIDADEELDEASFSQMREAIMRPQFGGYYFQIVNYMEAGVEANTYVHTAVRLFRNIPSVRFTGRIHEQIIGSFKDHGYVPATLSKGVLRHYGYQQETMVEKDKINRTITMLKREVEEVPQEPFHWFNLANAYSVAMMPAEAEVASTKCAELIEPESPFGPANFQILSSAQTALGRPEDAIRSCAWTIKKGYDTVLNEFERAHALLKLSRYEEALAAIDRCAEMDWPITLTGDFGIKTYKAKVLKAQILCGLLRYEEAEACVEYALDKHADFPMALFAKAGICEKTGRLAEAYDLYMRCSTSVGMGPSRKMAAHLAVELGRHEDAVRVYQQVWRDNPKDQEAWVGWANACLALGDWPGYALACEEMGEERLPGADVVVNWGRALAFQGDCEGAFKKFGEAVRRAPFNANAYFNCGDLLYKMGHFGEAAKVYKLGLEIEPLNADAWFVLGNCFAQLNVPAGARTSYAQALVLAPEHAGAKHNLDTIAEAA